MLQGVACAMIGPNSPSHAIYGTASEMQDSQPAIARYLLNQGRRHRTNVGPISRTRVCHDGRGVGVEQNDFVTLCLESLASLGTRIVELTCLANYNGTGANDHHSLDVRSAWVRICGVAWRTVACGRNERHHDRMPAFELLKNMQSKPHEELPHTLYELLQPAVAMAVSQS